MSRSWDVFCKVIDNFGDAAVCWRLARQIAREHGGQVRLWIDSLDALHALCPQLDVAQSKQVLDGIEVRTWAAGANFGAPPEIVIEAFGCGLPEGYVESMAGRSPRPAWIILEYLSAEPWVAAHHKMPSPHPRLPLERHFFFPGIAEGTGGVLREASLEPRRSAFESAPDSRAQFWKAQGFESPDAHAIGVSLFGYENAAVQGMLDTWSEGPAEVVVAVPASRIRPQVVEYFGGGDPGDGTCLKRGRLEVRLLPFLTQSVYDELLWACDWNFVRGEDSFVRAQWARRPFVWHIYPQAEKAHLAKLGAFLDAYCMGLDERVSAPLRSLWAVWNSPDPAPGTLGPLWKSLQEHRPALQSHAGDWAGTLAKPGELAANLAQYCEERLK